MNVFFAPSFLRSYKKLIKKNRPLQKVIKQKIALFRDNPYHHELRLHKLTGSMHETWSFSITHDIRLLFTNKNTDVLFVDIGKHEEVY